MPMTVQKQAEQCLRSWLSVISTTSMQVGEHTLATSASMGAVFLPQSRAKGLSFEQALSLADQGLYLAKEDGRNRACLITAFAPTDSPHVAAKIASKEMVLPG